MASSDPASPPTSDYVIYEWSLFDIVLFFLMVIKLFLIFEECSAKADKKGLFGSSRWLSFIFVQRSIHLHTIVELLKGIIILSFFKRLKDWRDKHPMNLVSMFSQTITSSGSITAILAFMNLRLSLHLGDIFSCVHSICNFHFIEVIDPELLIVWANIEPRFIGCRSFQPLSL